MSPLDYHPHSVILGNSTAAAYQLFPDIADCINSHTEGHFWKMEGLISQSQCFFFLFPLEHELADCIYKCFSMSINKCTLEVLKKSSHPSNYVTLTLKMFSQTDCLRRIFF